MPTDNENWLLEEGARIIQKKADSSLENLTAWELLVYCIWVADYGMRNAGDLDTASDVYAEFQATGLTSARSLSLSKSIEAFLLNRSELERSYLKRFEAICDEIRQPR